MRAAVVQAYGAAPTIETFPEPTSGEGQVVVRVTAASLNPADLGIASGRFPLRRPDPPFVVGLEGVGTLPNGQRVYFRDVPVPYGSVAERVPVDEAGLVLLPEGVDDALAAGLGVPGVTAWLSFKLRARLIPGETVLVLGAGGAVGQVAVQLAKALGAGHVVAAARSDATLKRARSQGADAVVQMGTAADLRSSLREAAPSGYDVILDLTWGAPIQAAIDAAAVGARVVQVGNLAGPDAALSAPSFRNKLMTIIGHTNFLTPGEQMREAYTQVVQRASVGQVTMELERIPLDQITDAWARLQAVSPRKLVIIP